MSGTTAVIFALSLILFDFTLICDANTVQNEFIASKFVFLNGVSLLLMSIPFIPEPLKTFMPVICFILETIISMILLEISLLTVFKTVQQYVSDNSDSMMTVVAKNQLLKTFICQKCCDSGGQCAQFVEELMLKAFSLGFLLTISTTFTIKI